MILLVLKLHVHVYHDSTYVHETITKHRQHVYMEITLQQLY